MRTKSNGGHLSRQARSPRQPASSTARKDPRSRKSKRSSRAAKKKTLRSGCKTLALQRQLHLAAFPGKLALQLELDMEASTTRKEGNAGQPHWSAKKRKIWSKTKDLKTFIKSVFQ